MTPSPDDTVLLEEQGQLETHQRKTLRELAFEVPPDTAALGISFDYHPRRLEDPTRALPLVERAVDGQLASAAAAGVPLDDQARPGVLAQPAVAGAHRQLRNLLNLALRDPGGRHRGRWDRNLDDAPCEEVVATSWASPGFVAGPISPGRWQATLEVHEILDAPCTFQLRVVGRNVVPAPDPSRRGAHRPPPEQEFHQPLPAGWLRGELHCHTTASDGAFALGELLERARALGLDFLAVTDHNTTAALEDEEQLGHRGLTVIRGCEITTFHGHFLALGLDPGEAPAWYQHERALSPAELAATVHDLGGLFGLAHPFVLGNPVCCGCRLEAEVPADRIDLLEVWSRGAEEAVACHQALRLFDTLRRAGHPVVAVAGRDWHDVAQERQGAVRAFPATVVRARPDAAGLLAALRRGACYLSTGPVVELQLVAGRRRATLGERLELGPDGPSITARVRVEGLAQPARLRLLHDGAPLLERALLPGAVALELPGVRPTPGDLRLELWTPGDLLEARPLVVTNPVQIRTIRTPGPRGRR